MKTLGLSNKSEKNGSTFIALDNKIKKNKFSHSLNI